MDRRTWALFTVGLVVAIAVGAGVSQLSSKDPDGLEFVAEQQGFADTAEDHGLSEVPLAAYGGGWGLNRAIAGVAGVLVTLGLGWTIFWFARRRGSGHEVLP